MQSSCYHVDFKADNVQGDDIKGDDNNFESSHDDADDDKGCNDDCCNHYESGDDSDISTKHARHDNVKGDNDCDNWYNNVPCDDVRRDADLHGHYPCFESANSNYVATKRSVVSTTDEFQWNGNNDSVSQHSSVRNDQWHFSDQQGYSCWMCYDC